MSHRVNEEINAEPKGFNRRLERIFAAIDVIPEIFEVVVLTSDYGNSAVVSLECVEERLAINQVRGYDIQGINAIKDIENLVIDGQSNQVTIREGTM